MFIPGSNFLPLSYSPWHKFHNGITSQMSLSQVLFSQGERESEGPVIS